MLSVRGRFLRIRKRTVTEGRNLQTAPLAKVDTQTQGGGVYWTLGLPARSRRDQWVLALAAVIVLDCS